MGGPARSAATTVRVPDAPFVHVFVARGAATLEGAGPLATGDAVRLTAAGALDAHRGSGRRRGAHLGEQLIPQVGET